MHGGLVYFVCIHLYEGSGLLLSFGMYRDYFYFFPNFSLSSFNLINIFLGFYLGGGAVEILFKSIVY